VRLTLLLCLIPFLALAEQEPEGRAEFVAASFNYHDGAYDDAIAGYQKTIALHHEVPFSKMMIARCLALRGDIEKAIEVLDEAAEFEFVGVQLLRTDPDFESLRPHPRFADILAKVQSNAAPCGPRARRHQLDFWIGEWDVTGPNGRVLGTDKVESAEGGCLIRESWSDAQSGTGQSVSFYNRLTGLWRQVWMDPSGQPLDLSGEFADGSLVLRQITYTGGLKTILTLAYTQALDGSVRQLLQRSVDDGATWTTLSDYSFRRKAR
jgi:hypothetical protein